MKNEIQNFVIVKDVVDVCKEELLDEEATFRFLVLKDLNTNHFYLSVPNKKKTITFKFSQEN